MTTNNWGRWGAKDERGTLNMITPDLVLRAIQTVRTGRVISLGCSINRTKMPVFEGRQSHNHFMTFDGGDWVKKSANAEGVEFADDYINMPTHHGTHIDALSHVWAHGQLFNGFPRDLVRSSGARVCDISKVGGVITRGVLLDVAGHQNVPHLPDGYIITAKDLEDCAQWAGVTVGPGDAVMIRTGWYSVFEKEPIRFNQSQPGIGMEGATYLTSRDISLIGCDNMTCERYPWEGHEEGAQMRAHVHLLRDCGVHIMELVMLDELATDKLYEFLFMVAQLNLRGAVGSPVNPVAVV